MRIMPPQEVILISGGQSSEGCPCFVLRKEGKSSGGKGALDIFEFCDGNSCFEVRGGN